MDSFEKILLRLKQQVNVRTDKEVAALLGLSDKAFNARKKRSKFPETEVYALAAKRPDLRLDVGFVLMGDRLTPNQRQALAVTAAYPPAAMPDGAMKVAKAFLEDNARRDEQYQRIIEALNGCSEESVDLVKQIAIRFSRLDNPN